MGVIDLITTAKFCAYDGKYLMVEPDSPLKRELLKKQVKEVEIRIVDGRSIRPLQRKKIFAIIKDISEWCGEDREYLRRYFLCDFCEDNNLEYFSLSDTDVTIARLFIDYLIRFCFSNSVPTNKPLFENTDDIYRYLYMCLEFCKCAVCNAKADIHHADAVGMGRDRNKIIHLGMKAVALCREHHNEAHNIGSGEFFRKHHIYGIELDEYLCTVLKLRKE